MKKSTDNSSAKLYNNWTRNISWIVSKSGVLTLAIEHFLAMLPATLLVPILVNNTIGMTVIDVSLVLFTSGLGTLVFTLCSARYETEIVDGKEKKVLRTIPAYLGSSFAYIAITIYLLESQSSQGLDPSMAFLYVGWAYMFSSLLLIILSTLFYFIKGIDRFFSKYLPAAVIGPAISLIGLELSDTAIADAGLNTADGTVDMKAVIVAMVTLVFIVLFSLIRRRFLKNAAIIVGMLAGYIVYILLYGTPEVSSFNILDFSFPDFRLPVLSLPPNWQGLLVAVIPATLVVFTESIGRVTVINRMKEENSDAKIFNAKSVKTIGRAVLSHGCASLASSFVGSVPNTIYAENIAVMGIHRNKRERIDPNPLINLLTHPYSAAPYMIAAGFAMLFAFSDALQNMILGIPKPVIGGMELFLFGVISAPGIQLLVDQRVNYKKVSNQIITAAVLLTGISELSIEISWFELKGMSLGLVVGFVLNLIVLILKWLGILCDPLTIDEVTLSCLNALPKDATAVTVSIPADSHQSIVYSDVQQLIAILENHGDDPISEQRRDTITHADTINICNRDGVAVVSVVKRENSLIVDVRKDTLDSNLVKAYLNDYVEAADGMRYDHETASVDSDFLRIDLSKNIPIRKVDDLIRQIQW